MQRKDILPSYGILLLLAGLLVICHRTGQTVKRTTAPECHCAEGAELAAIPVSWTQEKGKGADKSTSAQILPLQGMISRLHDPVMTKEGDTYYVFSTGRGISVSTSKDRVTWERHGQVFAQPVAWTATTIPGSSDFYWAPDISFFSGKWHLYYAVSTFGKNHSAIGLATNVTLDSRRPEYQWKAEGLVIESKTTDDWNAIDPNLVLDEHHTPWLTFGSFWGGIKMLKIAPATGKPEKPDAPLVSLASRPRTKEIKGAIEAPFLIRHGRFYYLFVSFDFCCRGVNSTYNIRVGRSSRINGPYKDREGNPMLEGGGTLVLSGTKRWRGPGHNAVYREGKTDWLVYHAYDADDNGVAKLRIEKLLWDAADWPQAPSRDADKAGADKAV